MLGAVINQMLISDCNILRERVADSRGMPPVCFAWHARVTVNEGSNQILLPGPNKMKKRKESNIRI